MKKTVSKLEEKAFKLLSIITGIEPDREVRFHPTRKWRFDFAFKEQFIAIEVEGGIWTGGAHVNPQGYAGNCEKYNMAAKMGWKVYRLVAKQIDQDYITSLLIDSDLDFKAP